MRHQQFTASPDAGHEPVEKHAVVLNESTGEEVVPLAAAHTPMPLTVTDVLSVVQVNSQSAFPVGACESPPVPVQVVPLPNATHFCTATAGTDTTARIADNITIFFICSYLCFNLLNKNHRCDANGKDVQNDPMNCVLIQYIRIPPDMNIRSRFRRNTKNGAIAPIVCFRRIGTGSDTPSPEHPATYPLYPIVIINSIA